MSNNTKRLLQLLTLVMVGVFAVIMVMGLVKGGNTGYLVVTQLIAAPFELVVLVVLWAVYISRHSLLQSVAGKGHATLRGTKSMKTSTQIPVASRVVARLSILSSLCGLSLIGWFAYVGGPNAGIGRHVFGGSDLYMDMQVGIVLLLVGALLAVLNHIAFRTPGK